MCRSNVGMGNSVQQTDKVAKKNTKQNKIIGRAKCCAAVNRKFCCNVDNSALVYQVIFCLG